jgi:hypothetical protein
MNKIYNGQISAKVTLPIYVISNQDIVFGASGSIELRKNSKSGQLIESFDTNSDKVKISARELIIYPTNQLPYETEIYVVISDGFILSKVNGSSFSEFSLDGNKEFKFQTEDSLGNFLEGGTVISKEGGRYTIISDEKYEMNLTWYEIYKAIEKTQNDTGKNGWYVPSLYELINYKDHLKSEESYWTNTEDTSEKAYLLNINTNTPYITNKIESHLIRLFKKVNY